MRPFLCVISRHGKIDKNFRKQGHIRLTEKFSSVKKTILRLILGRREWAQKNASKSFLTGFTEALHSIHFSGIPNDAQK